MVEIDVKDDFLLKNEVLLSKNVIFVYKGKYQKIQRKFSKNIETRFSILIHLSIKNALDKRVSIILKISFFLYKQKLHF